MSGTPPADIEINELIVRGLIQIQFPSLSELPLTEVGSGWDNVTYRLGEKLAIRIPRRKAFANSILIEQENLTKLTLNIPIPKPIYLGNPTMDFPYPWSIVPWLTGETADLQPPNPTEATTLANFLKSLHQPAPTDAPYNPYRGCNLDFREDMLQKGQLNINSLLPQHCQMQWRRALHAEPFPVENRPWVHGDLHPQNILTQDGTITAILDWGDLTSGDPAVDAAAFYMLFLEPNAIESYTTDPNLIARAQGWAILFVALILSKDPEQTSRHSQTCLQTLKTLAKAPLMP
ncbi:MAG: aminoglycoside phosphotransferase family protein [Fimbriimonadaceae bacterium]